MFSKTLFRLRRPASVTPHRGQASLTSEQDWHGWAPVLGGVCDRSHPLREAFHAGVGDAGHIGDTDSGAERPAR